MKKKVNLMTDGDEKLNQPPPQLERLRFQVVLTFREELVSRRYVFIST